MDKNEIINISNLVGGGIGELLKRYTENDKLTILKCDVVGNRSVKASRSNPGVKEFVDKLRMVVVPKVTIVGNNGFDKFGGDQLGLSKKMWALNLGLGITSNVVRISYYPNNENVERVKFPVVYASDKCIKQEGDKLVTVSHSILFENGTNESDETREKLNSISKTSARVDNDLRIEFWEKYSRSMEIVIYPNATIATAIENGDIKPNSEKQFSVDDVKKIFPEIVSYINSAPKDSMF